MKVLSLRGDGFGRKYEMNEKIKKEEVSMPESWGSSFWFPRF